MVKEVKDTARRRRSRISSKHQVTIPVDALRAAGLHEGDYVVIHADGPGKVTLERTEDVLAKYVGKLAGVWPPNALDELRNEWD